MSSIGVAELSPRLLGWPAEAVHAIDDLPETCRVIVVSAPPDANALKTQTELVNFFDELYATVLPEKVRAISKLDANRLFRRQLPDKSYSETVDSRLNAQYLARAMRVALGIGATCLDPALIFSDQGEFKGAPSWERIQRQLRNNPGRLVIPAGFGADETPGCTHLLTPDQPGTAHSYDFALNLLRGRNSGLIAIE